MFKQKLVYAIIMVVCTLAFTSCENEEMDVVKVKETSTSAVNSANTQELNTVQENSMFARRSSGYEWDGNLKIYDIDPSNQERLGTIFNFKVIAYPPLNSNDISIEFKAPLGGTYYKKMNKSISHSYSTYTKDIPLQQYGIYRYRYVRTSNYSAMSDYKEVHVILPPEDEDNLSYDNNVHPIYYQDGTIGDKYDFVYEECVSWVALKVNQLWGTNRKFNNKMFGTSDYNRLGDAEHWKDVLVRNGYTYSKTPRPNCIAWWKANDKGALSGGHVAFVHRAYPNGAIYLSEYNWYGKHHQHGTRYVEPHEDYYPTGFIYIPYR